MRNNARTYNLIDEPWIPVLWRDGHAERVGIGSALTNAGKIRQIAASNPMDNVSLLRFLLAVQQWCKPDTKTELEKPANTGLQGIPQDWLGNLSLHKDAFALLGDGQRFYQDISLQNKERRPIADLFVEFPGADSVNHMRHVVHDGSYGFCPACCALGILRFSVWASANRFYPASVNPGSAAYAMIEEKNLLQTLRANLPRTQAASAPPQAPWLLTAPPTAPDDVARLAWRPRKLWLNVGDRPGSCAYCGSNGLLIESLQNEGGWSTPATDGQQLGKDVLAEFQKINIAYKSKKSAERKLADKVVKVAQLIRKCRMAALGAADSQATGAPNPETDEQKIARVFHQLFAAGDQESIKELIKKVAKEEAPHLSESDMQVKKFWDEDPHLLKDAEALGLPDLNADAGIQASRFWRDALRLRGQRQGKVTAIGPVVNKFTFQDATSVSVPDEATNQRVERSANIRNGLSGLVKYTTPNRDRQHPEIHAATVLATPDAETRVQATLISKSDDEVLLCEIYEPVVGQIVGSTAKGSPLRRRAAKQHALALLSKNINEIVDKANQPAGAAEGDAQEKPAKTKRGRKEKGEA
ncbi:MAG: type I-E CRISPR-associated protein Cse1/CasA [Planctomycetota bacterium]|nr:type I-E CRISPR-associated protein Cse1/CasA [Planctomycetota bacterium]